MSSKERSQGSASSSPPRWAGLALVLLLSLLLPGVAQATHYYGGQISWERVSGSTVNITLTTVWRSNFIGSATIDFGDGNTAFSGSPPGAFQGMFTPPTSADTYSVYEQTFTHTYAGNGPFLVGISGCCRPGSVTNAANGDHVLQTLVDLSGGAFGSPAIDPSSVFGVGMRAGVTSGFTMSVADPAAEPITCSLSADPFPNVGYVIPPGLAVDPDSCVVTWDTAGTSVGQWYVFAVKAQNPSGNYALLDTWVEITGGTNTPPTCTGGAYQAAVGQPRSIAVQGIDPEGSALTAGLLGPIPGSTLTPGGGASPLTTTLAWTPTLADVGTATTTVAFFDAANRLGSCSVSVTVSVDDPPTCTSPGAITIDPGQPVAMDFVGTDPEGAALTSAAGTLPPGAAFGPTSGSSPLTSTFSWTPTLADAGTWSISATFSDPPANQVVCTDTVTVTTCVDTDGDGVDTCGGDCDDTDPGRYPGAPEICGDGTIQDCDATVDDICPPAGTGAIVEVMANPTGADPTGEWFEMLVAAGTPTFDLLGFEVCDLASNCFTIDTPTDASGGDRIVFGRPADLNVGFSGPVVVASNITLNNAGDTLTVTAPDGSVTATLNYDAAGFPSVSAGSSIQLDPSFIDEQTGSNWNTTPTGTTYGTTGAENGTPGAANVDVNQAPVAVSDILTVLEDAAAAVVNVVANDTDVDGDTLTVLSVGTPSQGGSASVVSGELVYAPGPDVNGTETVSYVVTDGALTDTATLTITITPVNDAPVAVPDAGTVAEDAAGTLFDVISNDTDIDGDTLSLWLVGAVSAGGVVSRVGDAISYTPAPNYTGIETVEYRVRDGNGGSALGLLTVTVTPVNDAPVAVADTVTVAEDAAATSIDVVANDTDVEGDTLSLTAVGTPDQGGAASVSGGQLLYTPAADFNGTETITYVVSDSALTNTGTVTVTVTPVNDAPIAVPDTATVAEDAAATLLDVITNDTDVDGDTLSLWLIGSVSAGGLAQRVGDMISYTPAANFNGTETVGYRVRDGNGGSALGVITITVTPVNDPPVAVPDSGTVAEDSVGTLLDVITNDTDVDGDTLSLWLVGAVSAGGQASRVGNAISYSPATDFNGTETIEYRVRDGNGGSALGVLTVTVTAVNDPPVASNDVGSTSQDTPATFDLRANDSDVDGDALLITAIGPAAGSGTVTITNGGLDVLYTPDAGFVGSDTFGYTVSDGTATATASVAVTVSNVNDTPVANADAATTDEDTAVSISVLDNDTDADGDTLSVAFVTAPSQGTAAIVGGLTITYTPDPNSNGVDTFSYTVDDGNGASAVGTVTVTINAVNDAPVAVADADTTSEDVAITIDVVANDTDVDGDALSLSSVGTAASGTVTIVAGEALYTPDPNTNGVDTFTYVVTDGALTATGTATVTVSPVNDAPVAAAGGPYTADEGASVALDGSGSSDLDGSVVTWEWDCDGDGTYEISSAAATGDTCSWDDEGTPTIALRVTDDGGLQAVATATATVSNVSPTLAALAAAQGPEGSAIGFSASATDPGVNDVLTYTWDFGDGTSGTGASPTATYATAGTYTVSVTVSDGDGGQDATTGTVVVTDVAPTVTSLTGDATLDEGSAGTWTAAGEDAGSTTGLVFAWDFGDGASQSAVTTASHTYADDGVFTLAVTVTDDEGSTASSTLAVTVANVAPVIAGTPAGTALQDIPWTYAPTATDPGADTLSWSLVSAPAAMQIDAGTGAITWTPTYADSLVGSFTFDVLVDDGDAGSDSQSVSIAVASADTDGDGMSDDWEAANGLDPSDASDATLDPDADGLTNLDEFQGGTDPAVFDGPGLATLVSPIQGDAASAAMPTLVWDNAADPQNDTLTYAVEVYEDSALLTLLTSTSGLTEDASGQTAWTVDVALPENGTAWWRVRAADPWVDGGWATAESFVVNAVNEEPGQPVAVAPVDVLVQSGTPTLEWVDVSDVDGDAITYTIEVWDSGGTTLLASAAEVPPAEGPNSTWTVDTPLDDDGAFSWRVAAVDEHGLAGPWSADAAFWVNSDNGAPGAVLFTSPSNGDALETLSPALTITATTDMEADTLTYVIEIDTVATFDGPDIDSVTRTEADLTWDLEAEGVALPEHATVYARAWAEDSLGAAGPVETISFFLRGANDPPGVPELVAPIDPSSETVEPTLLVATPIDPEGDEVVLEFRVFGDAEGTVEVASAAGVVAGTGGEAAGQTGWPMDVELVGPFWWTARSVDALDAASDWAELAAARAPTPAEPPPDEPPPEEVDGCAECQSSVSTAQAPTRVALLLLALGGLAARRRRA